MPKNKKKRKLSQSRQRKRGSEDLKRAADSIRKDMNTVDLSPGTAVQLFNNWTHPFKSLDKFKRFDWKGQKLKAGLAGVKIMRFEADRQSKLWVTLETDDALNTDFFDDALRAVISGNVTTSKGEDPLPGEIIFHASAATATEIQTKIEELLTELGESGDAPAMGIAKVEKTPIKKGAQVMRFLLAADEPPTKRQKIDDAEEEKESQPPIATWGRTVPTGATSSTGGGKESGSGDTDSDEGKSGAPEGRRGRGGSDTGGSGDGGDGGDDREHKRRRAHEEEEVADDDEAEESADGEEEDENNDLKRGRAEDEESEKRRKRRRTLKEEDEDDDDAEGDDEEESTPRWTTPTVPLRLANLRHGISLNNYSIEQLESLPELHYAYGEHPHQSTLLRAWEARRHAGDLVHYSGGDIQHLPHPLNAPAAIIAELTPQQVNEIVAVKSQKKLNILLKKYEDAGAVTLFLAAWLHHGEGKWLAKERNSIRLIRQILTPVEKSENVDNLIKPVLKLLPARIGKKKRGKVLETIALIQTVLNESGFVEDYENARVLDTHVEAIKKILNEEGDRFKLFLSLYDYANTLYAQFRDALETPWNLPTTGQTKDTLVQKRAIILAAQLALLQPEMLPMPEEQWAFRWIEGIEHFYPGQLIAPTALWSTSRGSQASEAFGGKDERTFFMIRNCHSGRLVQLLTGTKNWYQREVLFPAYVQLVVKLRHEFKTDKKDQNGDPIREVGYILEEVEGGIRQYLQDVIPGIGLPFHEDQIPVSDDFLLCSLVDQRHQQLFKVVKTLTGKTLEDAGIELNGRGETENIPLTLIYGAETHEAWNRIMRRKDLRREILTLDMLKSCFFGLRIKLKANDKDEEGYLPARLEDVVFRDFEDGWGSDGVYFNLNEAQRKALTAHGLLFYPTIEAGAEELQNYIAWVAGRGGQKIETIAGEKSKAAYLKELKKRNSDKELPELRMPVTGELMEEFWNWKEKQNKKRRPYNPDEQQYEVTYGDPMDGDENVMLTNLTEALEKFSIALEQSLALYIDKKVTRQEYVTWVYRFAALVQQSIVAAHPFADGNGRLSRLVMYKVLMAYLPAEVLLAEGLPLIQEPGNDLYSTEEEWTEVLIGSPRMRVVTAAAGVSPPLPGSKDTNADDGSSGDKGDKPSGGQGPGKPGRDNENKSGGDSGKGGRGQQPPSLRRTYKGGDADENQLQTFLTAGGGNCGIHAMRGAPNQRGVFEAANHLELRGNLSRRIFEVRNGPHRERFTLLLNQLLAQITSHQRLDTDLFALWKNMNAQIQNMSQQLGDTLAQSRSAQRELQNRLEQLETAISECLADGEEDTNTLRNTLAAEIRNSNDDNLADLREQLPAVKTHEEFIKFLLNLDRNRLLGLIFENLDILIDKLPERSGQIQLDYEQYQADAKAAQSPFREFTDAHYDALMQAYANSVAIDGYYLRDEDLMVLADMSDRGLVIYVENSDRPGHFVAAVNHNPQGYADVLEVFHKGLHYERANLIRPAVQPLLLARQDLTQ